MKYLFLISFSFILFLGVVFFIRKDKLNIELEKEKEHYGGLTRQQFKQGLTNDYEKIWKQGMTNWLTVENLEAREWYNAIIERGSTPKDSIDWLWNNNLAGTLEYFDQRDGWRFDWFKSKVKELTKKSLLDKNIQIVIKEIQNR